MWPDHDRPVCGIFVKRQVEPLRAAGTRCDVLYLRGYGSKIAYLSAALRFLAANISWRKQYRLVHVHSGGTSLSARFFLASPMLVTFHGDDVLGDRRGDGTISLYSRLRSSVIRANSVLFTATITQSKEMHERLPRAARRNDTVIACGVSTGLFRPMERAEARKQLGWSQSERVVLFAATFPDAARTRKIVRARALPVFVLYNIPRRDCGAYSAGGARSGAAYKRWISDFAAGAGRRKLAVVIEPDALAGLDCLGPAARTARYALIRYAVERIATNPRAAIYLDAGNSDWQSPAVMAKRLRRAGIAKARGFALNVSNYQTTTASVAYGNRLARLLGRKHYVIDTSRNGLGPWDGPEYWCNPPGRALGQRPGVKTASPLADAYLWIKLPGESDGACKGGPSSGSWWPEYALGLAERARW